TRRPDWYFFTVFGTPAKNSKWGWRVEGHHLSLNFTVDNGEVVSATPAFFGANPATVKGGAKKGQRTLAGGEDLAKELCEALDEDQQKLAYHKKAFPEPQARTKVAKVGDPVGISAEKLNEKQKAILMKLLHTYTDRMPAEVGEDQIKKVKQ